MNVFQRQMFSRGDEVVNVDRLIQYYTAQEYAPAEVVKIIKGKFPTIETATVLDKMREYKELFPEKLFPADQTTMPPAAISQEVRADLEPNQIQYRDGSREDYSVAINRIRNDDIRLENVFALYNTPGVSLGSNVKKAVEDYIRRKQPEILQTRDEFGNPIPIQDLRGRGIQSLDEYSAIDAINVPTSYQFLGRQLLGAIKEGGREGLETLGDIVGGESVGDLFRGDFMGGDPDMFMRSGGRDINAVTEMAKAMNNPDQIRTRTGFIGDAAVDTISDLFGSLDVSTPNLDATVDQLREKANLDPISRDLENINDEPVSNEAKDAGGPDVDDPEVPVTEVKEGGGDDDKNTDEEQVKTLGTGEAAKPDLKDGESTKRNFGEFIQSPDFIRFARNLGKGLSTTGQIGQGIALGAAGAAEEKYAEEVAGREAFNELLKEEIKQKAEGGLKPSELQALNSNVSEMSENIQFFEGTEASIQIMDDLIGVFENARLSGGRVSGVFGQFDIYADKLKALSGMDFDPSDATQITNAIEQVKQRSIREILNESGRTISDLDRQIVEKIFGGIDLTSAPSEIIKKLRKGRADLQKNNADKQRKISITYRTVIDPIYGNRGLNLILPFKDTIDKILDAKPGDNYSLTPTSSSLYPSNIIFLDKSKT
jgi:hypothetical protein